MRRAWLVVVAVLLACLTPAARAATPRGPAALPTPVSLPLDRFVSQVTPLVDYVRAGFAPGDAAELHLVSTLVASGVPARAFGLHVRAQAPSVPCGTYSFSLGRGTPIADVGPAGDLNGDRRPDVLESHGSQLTKTTGRWVGSARDARTGKTIWQRSLVLNEREGVVLLSARVGAARKPGALLLRYEFLVDPTPAVWSTQLNLRFEGLDGRGRTTWSRSTSGSNRFSVSSFGYRWDDYPASVYLAQLRLGAHDVLIHRYKSLGQTVTSTVDRVAVESGALSHPYPAVPSSAGADPLGQVKDLVFGDDSLPSFWLVPDQNGDRRTDVLLARVSGTPTVTAYRGDTGVLVWSNSLLPLGVRLSVFDAGVMTQPETKVHDLALVTNGPIGIGLVAPRPGVGDRTEGTVLLLQGGQGTLLWALPGTGVFTMHRYAGTPAIGVTSSSTSVEPDLSSKLITEVDVVDALGLVRAVNTYAVTQDSAVCRSALVIVANSDDFTADAAPEAQVLFLVHGANEVVTRWITVNGGDGRELDRSAAFSLGGAVDGRGVDRATVALDKSVLTFNVLRGDALSKRLFQTTLPAVGQLLGVGLAALPAVGTTCQDVLATSLTDQATTLALLSGNGRPWWTLTASTADPLGRVVVGRGARNLC